MKDAILSLIVALIATCGLAFVLAFAADVRAIPSWLP